MSNFGLNYDPDYDAYALPEGRIKDLAAFRKDFPNARYTEEIDCYWIEEDELGRLEGHLNY